ncbi:hypothetical protein BN2497_1801 [Janthinobacterium sp. CG23_2]|nr:hypothetical protein BN2497_1801 [Janthinobacterium sp. CG23_2]CUU27298.1 hypothetical protein BN3177_1801 [Janthinobacterium sp. CG23_2]
MHGWHRCVPSLHIEEQMWRNYGEMWSNYEIRDGVRDGGR